MHCIYSYPERLALQISRQEAELSIRCEIPGGGTGWFLISVWNGEGERPIRRFMKAGKRVTLRLSAGRCRLQVKNYSNLNPGSFTKWLRLEPETRGSLCLLYARPLCFPLGVPISFSTSGTDYLGITV